MTYIRKLAGFLLFTIAVLQASAQSSNENGNYNLRAVLPPSANTASLGKFGEIPVSLYTGIPSISIPLYDIKDGGLGVPISLSYHAGGIRVEEVASNVGIGWALSAGGIVGRQVRGKPDEDGWVSPDINHRVSKLLQSSDIGTSSTTSIALESGNRDGEADIYYYNFAGKSGKFILDEAGNVYGYPATGVKIDPLDFPYLGTSGWRITTEDGTVYRFDKAERITTNDNGDVPTAWYLSKVTSADGAKEINFIYEGYSYSTMSFYGQTQYFYVSGGGTGQLSYGPGGSQSTFTSTVRLTKIQFSDGFVVFNYINPREDYENGFDKSLDRIDVYNSSNELIKRYDLAYSYFGSGSFDYKRLKLNTITEKTLTQQKPPYEFTYNETIQAVSRNSFSKDHWGYYNAKGNTTLIPPFKAYNASYVLTNYNSGGADRNTDTTSAKAFMLKKITYPTGGETEFTFESNTSADPRLNYATPHVELQSLGVDEDYGTHPSPFETSSYITIPNSGAEARITVSGITSSFPGCDGLQVHLTRNGIVQATLSDNANGFYMTMAPGVWRLKAEYDCASIYKLKVEVNFALTMPDPTTTGNRPVGGMRVKQIVSSPNNGGQPVIKKYQYVDKESPTLSSGILVNFPTYGYQLHQENWSSVNGSPPGLSGNFNYIAAQANTNYPLARTQGSYVGYSNVVEDLGTNGEIRHEFLAYESQQVEFPFPPVESYDWRRGSELSTKFFARKNGQLAPVKTVDNFYSTMYLALIPSYKMGRNEISTGVPPGYTFAPYTTYYSNPQFYALSQTKERLYNINDASKFVETVTDYTYDPNHYQVNNVTKTGSAGETKITTYTYPTDNAGTQPYTQMVAKNIIFPVIEQTEYKNSVSSANFLRSTKTDYAFWANGAAVSTVNDRIYPQMIWSKKGNPANYWDLRTWITSYGDDGKTREVHEKWAGPPTGYLWGYNRQYPIAEAKNAKVNEIYHNNFEETTDFPAGFVTKDNTMARTGDYSGKIVNPNATELVINSTYLLPVNLGTTAKKFRFSGWVYNTGLGADIHLFGKLNGGALTPLEWAGTAETNKWVYLEKEVTVAANTTELSLRLDNNGAGTVWFDDLRIMPADAQMTTFTYKPLIGTSSTTDNNGITTYYDYDSYQRLMNVRDKDKKIIKHMDYNYKQ
jgi:hypothetical protein